MIVTNLISLTLGLCCQLPVSASATPEPGWPLPQPASSTFVDLDGDGVTEVLLAGVGGGFGVHVRHADGTIRVPSFLYNGTPAYATDFARVGDVNGDGQLDVVIRALLSMSGTNVFEWAFVFDREGNLLPGWPVGIDSQNIILADLTGDGSMELVYRTRLSSCQFEVMALEGDGTLLPGWPVQFCGTTTAFLGRLAAGDLDFDGKWEVVASLRRPGQNTVMYAFDVTGEFLPGWPKELPSPDAPRRYAIADLDGDFVCEIVAMGFDELLFVKANGDLYLPPDFFGAPNDMALGDVNGDGVLDLALVGQFDAWIVDGATGLRTVGNLTQPGPHHAVRLADFDGNGVTDVMTVSLANGSGSLIEFFDGAMQPILGSIEFPDGVEVRNHVVGQLDSDRELEITHSQITPSVSNVYLWELEAPGPIDPTVAWGMDGHDSTGAGFYHHGNYPERRFVRGDLNRDNVVDISDVIATGRMLFLGAEYSCPAASDFNEDANHNILDLVGLVYYLYANGPAPSAPFPQCEGNNGARFPCQNFVCP